MSGSELEDGELPTTLPTRVTGLPGAFTSPTISSKLDQAVATFAPGANGFKGAVRIEEQDGSVVVMAIAAVKIADGWALYGEAALDLHGNKAFEIGAEGSW